MALPTFWIKKMFKLISPPNLNNPNAAYTNDMFSGDHYNILSCRFKLPPQNTWDGHPYFYEILKGYEGLIDQEPKSMEDLFSTPLWYNRTLHTTFDCHLSRLGFNFIKDIFPENQKMSMAWMEQQNLDLNTKLKLLAIVFRIPINYVSLVERSEKSLITVKPKPFMYQGEITKNLKMLTSKDIYNFLIEDEILLPRVSPLLKDARGTCSNKCFNIKLG